MTQFFAKKLNKKGFTLAELLIVVAIIAILVAIAIPIFTSEIEKARISRDKANARNIKAAAVAEILDNTKGYDLTKKGWKITATIDEEGTIKISEIAGADSSVSPADPAYGRFKYDGSTPIKIGLLPLEISDFNPSGLS